MAVDPEIVIAVISAITAIALGFFKLIVEVRAVHKLVNSRMTELLNLTRVAAVARGRLDGEEVRKDRLDMPGTIEESKDAADRAPE